MQLAALALPAHPRPLALVPEPPPVEEEKAVATARRSAVTPVETRHRLAGRDERVLVSRHALPGRIGPVRQDGETQIAVGIRQVMHFEPFDLLGGLGRIGQQRRDHDHGPQRGRHALAQVEPRQHARRNERRQAAIHEGDGQIGGGDECQTSEQEQGRQPDP